MPLVCGDGKDDTRVLELTYTRMVNERDRLRDARAFFARQLGPLPTVAGVSLTLIVALTSDDADRWWLVALAGVALVAMVGISFLSSRIPPYRELRKKAKVKGKSYGRAAETPASWYEAEIELEKTLYGLLEHAVGRERRAVFAVQFLFLAAIACLVAAAW